MPHILADADPCLGARLATLTKVSGDFPQDWFRPGPPDEGDRDAAGPSPFAVRRPSGETGTTETGSTETGTKKTGPEETGPEETDPEETDPEGVGAEQTAGEQVSEDVPDPGGSDQAPTRWRLKESAAVPVLTSAHAARTVDLDDLLPRTERRAVMQRRVWLVLVSVVLLALVAGLAGGALIRRALDGRPVAPPTTTAPLTSSVNGTAMQPWTGDTAVLVATSATARCTAPAGRDGSGQYVTYDPANTLDDQLATAWRCDGNGVNQTLEFTFAPGSQLVGVGIVNGYAKGEGTASLYDQYRRVVSVRWDLPDGSWFSQNLSENSRSVQQLMIPPMAADRVRLTIVASTSPGMRGDPSRDAVLLSTVRFFTKA